jgi:hypothetical protein
MLMEGSTQMFTGTLVSGAMCRQRIGDSDAGHVQKTKARLSLAFVD